MEVWSLCQSCGRWFSHEGWRNADEPQSPCPACGAELRTIRAHGDNGMEATHPGSWRERIPENWLG